jgi:hypothetical protein
MTTISDPFWSYQADVSDAPNIYGSNINKFRPTQIRLTWVREDEGWVFSDGVVSGLRILKNGEVGRYSEYLLFMGDDDDRAPEWVRQLIADQTPKD